MYLISMDIGHIRCKLALTALQRQLQIWKWSQESSLWDQEQGRQGEGDIKRTGTDKRQI